ncbi:hypothetical protein [Ramlibacter sp.]|uniref:hypothetical protein n=1 Tax=Ramlibacter sp. TaxID=1917967 RepID=UPI002B8B5A50|nr:hypothetical protein [Ramlibacter sp.]HWI82814.1 hypothetical protein [Ramlibacter sp.]
MRTAILAGALAALCPLLLPTAAHAGPNQYVHTPIVEEGEKEIDFKWGLEKHRDGSSETATSIGFGWGATSWWFTEIYGKWHREPAARTSFDAWEWENKFQLAPTGKYPVDVGFLLEIERPKDRAEGYELVFGPLLQSEWGPVQGNLNLLWERHVRASEPHDTELKYEAQLKYRGSERLEWGAQAFGEFGRWDHWSKSSQQEHLVGPAIFGKIKAGATQAIKYNAALLFGVTNASPRTALRVQAEYEF